MLTALENVQEARVGAANVTGGQGKAKTGAMGVVVTHEIDQKKSAILKWISVNINKHCMSLLMISRR